VSTLEEKLKHRDLLFQKHTFEILKNIPHVLEAVIQHLDIAQEAESGNLLWEDVGRYGDKNDERGIVVLVGVVTYQPGDTFELTNKEVIDITEDTSDYFKRMIRIGIPFDLADNGSTAEVLEFLNDSDDIESELTIDDDDYEELSKEIEEEDATGGANITSDDINNGFNMDALTPTQLEAFNLLSKNTGRKK